MGEHRPLSHQFMQHSRNNLSYKNYCQQITKQERSNQARHIDADMGLHMYYFEPNKTLIEKQQGAKKK
jgi:hypothetical protein